MATCASSSTSSASLSATLTLSLGGLDIFRVAGLTACWRGSNLCLVHDRRARDWTSARLVRSGDICLEALTSGQIDTLRAARR